MKRWTTGVIAVVTLASAVRAQTPSDLYQRAVMAERTAGRLDSAIALYQRVVRSAGADRPLAARALLSMGHAYEALGRAEARGAYERLLREYGDQREPAAQARARIAALDPSARRSGSSSSSTVAMIRRVSRDPHDFRTGTVSPNGRYVSYTNEETGDLAVHDLSSGTNRLLTANGQIERSNGWAAGSMISPNGLDIAYVWYADSAGKRRSELRVVPLRGGISRAVTPRDMAYLELCGWSPDGKSVLAVVGRSSMPDGRGALALVDVERATVHRLRDFAFSSALGASVSPDGKWIVFAVPVHDELGRNPSIRVMAADGSHEHALVDHPSASWRPIWTPNGRGIVFQSDRAGSVGLWFLDVVDGEARSEPVALMSDVRQQELLGFASDGRLFYTPMPLVDISVVALDARTGEVLGEPRSVMKRFIGMNRDPDVSPDGRLLSFVSVRPPGSHTGLLVIVDLASGDQREFSPPLVAFQHQRWSRDGRSILLVGRALNRDNGFYRFDPVTGTLDALTTSPRLSFIPAAWSADGRSIFYPRIDSASLNTSVWRYDLDDSTHRVVYAPDSLLSVRAIAPSLDGKWLAFNATYRNGAGASAQRSVALSLATHELHALESGNGYVSLTSLAGGDVLGLRHRSSDSVTELWRVSLGAGTSRKLAFELRAKTADWPRVAADGSRIAFSIVRDDPNAGGIWTMENFLPAPKKGK